MSSKTGHKKFSILAGWFVCGLGALFYCYEYMLRIEPSVMIPQLMHEFQVTATGLGFLSAIYYYAYTPMQLAVGVLIDKYGTRIILTVAITACAVGNLIFGNVHDVYLAATGRVLIGFGSAFAFVGVLKLAAEWLPKHHFAFFTGFATALGMVGAMAGDVELTLLIGRVGWKNTLHIATIIGVIMVPLIWMVVRDRPACSGESESLTYRETFAGVYQIVKNPNMWFAGLIGCVLYLSLSVIAELWGIPFLQAVYHLPAQSAAFACSLIFMGWLVGAPFNGWLSDKTKNRRMPLVAGGILAAICIGIIIYKPFHMPVYWLYSLLFLFGVFSSTEIICFAIGKENNPTHIAASAVAFTNLLIMSGGILFQPLIGKMLEWGWDGAVRHGVHIYSSHSYQYALMIVPGLMLIGSLLAVFMPETYGHDEKWDEFD